LDGSLQARGRRGSREKAGSNSEKALFSTAQRKGGGEEDEREAAAGERKKNEAAHRSASLPPKREKAFQGGRHDLTRKKDSERKDCD